MTDVSESLSEQETFVCLLLWKLVLQEAPVQQHHMFKDFLLGVNHTVSKKRAKTTLCKMYVRRVFFFSLFWTFLWSVVAALTSRFSCCSSPKCVNMFRIIPRKSNFITVTALFKAAGTYQNTSGEHNVMIADQTSADHSWSNVKFLKLLLLLCVACP